MAASSYNRSSDTSNWPNGLTPDPLKLIVIEDPVHLQHRQHLKLTQWTNNRPTQTYRRHSTLTALVTLETDPVDQQHGPNRLQQQTPWNLKQNQWTRTTGPVNPNNRPSEPEQQAQWTTPDPMEPKKDPMKLTTTDPNNLQISSELLQKHNATYNIQSEIQVRTDPANNSRPNKTK